MTPRPLHGPDAQVLDFLVQVCRIGERRGAWGVADVRRVAADHLHPRYVRPPAVEVHVKDSRRKSA